MYIKVLCDIENIELNVYIEDIKSGIATPQINYEQQLTDDLKLNY